VEVGHVDRFIKDVSIAHHRHSSQRTIGSTAFCPQGGEEFKAPILGPHNIQMGDCRVVRFPRGLVNRLYRR